MFFRSSTLSTCGTWTSVTARSSLPFLFWMNPRESAAFSQRTTGKEMKMKKLLSRRTHDHSTKYKTRNHKSLPSYLHVAFLKESFGVSLVYRAWRLYYPCLKKMFKANPTHIYRNRHTFDTMLDFTKEIFRLKNVCSNI